MHVIRDDANFYRLGFIMRSQPCFVRSYYFGSAHPPSNVSFFFLKDPAPPEFSPLPLPAALPFWLAEDRLQLGRRSRVRFGGRPCHRSNRLGGVPRPLGEDPDAMKLRVGRRIRKAADRRAQPAPWGGGQRGQHPLRRLVPVGQRLRGMRRGDESLEQVDVPLRVEIREQLLPQLVDLGLEQLQEGRG